MTTLTEDKIETILSSIIDENTGKDLVSSDNVKNISIDDEIVNVELLLKYPAANFHEDLKGTVEEAYPKKASTIPIYPFNPKFHPMKLKALMPYQGLKILSLLPQVKAALVSQRLQSI